MGGRVGGGEGGYRNTDPIQTISEGPLVSALNSFTALPPPRACNPAEPTGPTSGSHR